MTWWSQADCLNDDRAEWSGVLRVVDQLTPPSEKGWVRNQKWQPGTGSRYEITYVLARIHDGNTISRWNFVAISHTNWDIRYSLSTSGYRPPSLISHLPRQMAVFRSVYLCCLSTRLWQALNVSSARSAVRAQPRPYIELVVAQRCSVQQGSLSGLPRSVHISTTLANLHWLHAAQVRTHHV